MSKASLPRSNLQGLMGVVTEEWWIAWERLTKQKEYQASTESAISPYVECLWLLLCRIYCMSVIVTAVTVSCKLPSYFRVSFLVFLVFHMAPFNSWPTRNSRRSTIPTKSECMMQNLWVAKTGKQNWVHTSLTLLRVTKPSFMLYLQ